MAGTAERTMALRLIGDVGRIGKDLGGVTKDLDKVDKKAARVKRSLRGVGSSIASWSRAFSGALVIGGIEAVTDAIGDAWAGFRSGQQVAAQLGVTWDNLGKDAERLDHWLSKVTDSTLRLGTSDDEAVQVFNDSIKRTGNAGESYRRLSIAQDLAASKGISLGAAMRIADKAATGSKKTVDEFGLKSKTAGGRVAELGRKVRGAAKSKAKLDPLGVLFNQMDEDLEGIVGSLATGDIDGAIEAIAKAGDHLAESWAKIVPDFEGFIGPGTVVGGVLDVIGAGMARLNPLFAGAVALAGSLASALGDTLGVAFQQVRDGPLADFISAVGEPLAGALNFSLQAAVTLLQTVADLLRGDFGKAIGDAAAGLGAMARTVDEAFRKTAAAVGGLVGGIIDAWNMLDFNIPAGSFQFTPGVHFDTPLGAIDIPAIGFSWTGSGDLIPDIGRQTGWTGAAANKGAFARSKGGRFVPGGPSTRLPGLADGGIVPATPGGTLARIGEGRYPEAVIPLDGRHMGDTYITVPITVQAPVGADGARTGQEIARYLDAYFGRGGRFRYKPVGGNG